MKSKRPFNHHNDCTEGGECIVVPPCRNECKAGKVSQKQLDNALRVVKATDDLFNQLNNYSEQGR